MRYQWGLVAHDECGYDRCPCMQLQPTLCGPLHAARLASFLMGQQGINHACNGMQATWVMHSGPLRVNLRG